MRAQSSTDVPVPPPLLIRSRAHILRVLAVGRTLKPVDFFVRVFYAKTGKQRVNKEKDGFRNRTVFLAKGLQVLKLVILHNGTK